VTSCFSLFIPINTLTILSFVAMAGGMYFFFTGFRLLARKRLLLGTPTSKIRSAALGLVEVNGMAAGPYTVPAPILGQPCFLYHTTAWQQQEGKKDEWEKVADETLHLPFFVDDFTGQLLVEPLGADLDLHRDFHEEYASSFFSSNLDEMPPRVRAFLFRHGVVPSRRLRIEERAIKPGDALFIAGTLTENPGVQVRPLSPLGGPQRSSALSYSSERAPAPQIIKLSSGPAPASTQEMSQQAKIAAALSRAGITKPEAWAAARVPYQSVAVEENEENAPPATASATKPDRSGSSEFNLNPPVALMKGTNNSTFVISFRSQKEFVIALAWKSAAMVSGGAAIAILGLYTLLAQMALP
jgi:E3 Ubiquitin ligase